MYMQAFVGPGIKGVHIDFLHLILDSIRLPSLGSVTRNSKVPVMDLSPLYIPEISHHWLNGAGVGFGVVGAICCLPVPSQSADTHT